MAKLAEGLFQNIKGFGRQDPTQPARQLAQASPYKQMGTTDPLARRVGSLFGNLGIDTSYMQTGEERAGAAMAEASKGQFESPEGRMIAMLEAQLPTLRPQAQMEAVDKIRQLRAIEQARAEKEQQTALTAATQAKDAAIQLQIRNSLADRAEALKLDGVAKTLKAGGSIVDAQKAIREEEVKNLAKTSGKPYREMQGELYGLKPEDVATLSSSSDEQFDKVLKGLEGEPKPYLNEKNEVVFYRTLKQVGKVLAPDGTFRNPQELNLKPAPNVSRVISQVDVGDEAFTKKLEEKQATSYDEALLQAQSAPLAYESNLRTLEALNSDAGMFTGPLAPFAQGAARLAYAFGAAGETLEEKIKNTELLAVERGEVLLAKISKLGSGSAISDGDRIFLEKITGGDMSLTEEAIREILRIERKVLNSQIELSNELTKRHFTRGKLNEKDAQAFAVKPLDIIETDELSYPKTPEEARNVWEQAPVGSYVNSPNGLKFLKTATGFEPIK